MKSLRVKKRNRAAPLDTRCWKCDAPGEVIVTHGKPGLPPIFSCLEGHQGPESHLAVLMRTTGDWGLRNISPITLDAQAKLREAMRAVMSE